MGRHSKSWTVSGDLVAGRLLVAIVLILGPAAMVAGLLNPPPTLYGPNAALGLWVPLTLIVTSVLVLTVQRPRRMTVFRPLTPYILALGYGAVSLIWSPDASEGARLLLQLSALIAVFTAAWHMTLEPTLRAWMRWAAVGAMLAIGLLFVVAWMTVWVPRSDLARLMGIATLGLPAAFVLSTFAKRSTAWTLLVGGTALTIALAADARMVALVLAILLVSSPALQVRTWVRVGAAIAAVVVVLILSIGNGFEGQWFFFNEGGSFSELAGTDESILGGRAVVWSELVARCDDSPVVGNGLGASNVWGLEIDPSFPEPHNEYIRTYCDLGIPFATIFWAFFVLAGFHASQGVFGRIQPSASGVAALQLLLALGLLALTDIPLTATAQFLAPLALVLAWSDRTRRLR